MIILVQPMYSKQELNADSNYVVYTSLIRAMLKHRTEWRWIVIFPDAKSGYKNEDDGFFSLPNVMRIPQRISPRKMANAISFRSEWYEKLLRTYGINITWVNLVEITGQIKRSGGSCYEAAGHPLAIAAHNYVIHRSLPYKFEEMDVIAWAQVMGGALADWNVFNSCHCRSMWIETAMEYLRSDYLDEILERSQVLPYGTLEPSIEYTDPGNEIPIIAYNHRLQAYKNYEKTFELLDELHREGIQFRLRYMNNNREGITKIAKYPWVEVQLCRNRAEYLEALRGCDLNIINSQHETFCISGIESMAHGQPLIAPDGVTFPEITGRKETRYPYLFSDRKEQKAMVRKLLTDPDERRKWGKVLSEFTLREFNHDLWAKRYAELFERLEANMKLGISDEARDRIRETLQESGKIEIRKMYRKCYDMRFNGKQSFGNQSMPLTKLLRVIQRIGGKSTLERGIQYLSMDQE